MVKLGINIDHVATVRQARLGIEPDVLKAALLAEQAGAAGITVHLREDRRHIQDNDVVKLKQNIKTKLNLEMSIANEIVDIACDIKPQDVCLVPEKREELTTEGGLDVVKYEQDIKNAIKKLKSKNIRVSLFIDPDEKQVIASKQVGADVVELHTGCYANASTQNEHTKELGLLKNAAKLAHNEGLIVNAGHGLDYENVIAILDIPHLHELNIGHSIIARSIYVGISQAVKQMKDIIEKY